TNSRKPGRLRHGIDELANGLANDSNGKKKDDESDDHATDVIGGPEPPRIYQSKNDGGESDYGGNEIGDVVPGVGFESAAIDFFADTEFCSGEGYFEKKRSEQWIESIDSESIRFVEANP